MEVIELNGFKICTSEVRRSAAVYYLGKEMGFENVALLYYLQTYCTRGL